MGSKRRYGTHERVKGIERSKQEKIKHQGEIYLWLKFSLTQDMVDPFAAAPPSDPPCPVKIFIDPGHGGSDGGAAANGLKEKDVTLKIAKKIRSRLGNYEGVSTKMSRTTDKYISLTGRTNMANSWNADFFLSIH